MPVIITLALDLLKKYWKVFAILIAIAAICGCIYAGYEHIVQIGYQKGFTAGQADKQKVIDAMTAQQSKDNRVLNDKIKGLESQSAAAAASEFALRAQLQTAHGQIITKYVQANPQSANGCGIDKPMATTINQLLMADPSIVSGGK